MIKRIQVVKKDNKTYSILNFSFGKLRLWSSFIPIQNAYRCSESTDFASNLIMGFSGNLEGGKVP